MLWYVMLGSALGGGSRFLLGTFVQTRSGAVFPVGTLIINVTGSLLLGFIVRYTADSSAISPESRGLSFLSAHPPPESFPPAKLPPTRPSWPLILMASDSHGP